MICNVNVSINLFKDVMYKHRSIGINNNSDIEICIWYALVTLSLYQVPIACLHRKCIKISLILIVISNTKISVVLTRSSGYYVIFCLLMI